MTQLSEQRLTEHRLTEQRLIQDRPADGDLTTAGLLAPPAEGQDAALSAMRAYSEWLGLPLMCVDAATGLPLAQMGRELIPLVPAAVRKQLADVQGPAVIEFASGLLYFVLPLPDLDGSRVSAVGYAFSRSGARPPELVVAAAENDWSQSRLESWIAQQEVYSPAVLRRLITLAEELRRTEEQAAALERDFDGFYRELDQTYEQINLLHTLAQKLQISRASVELAEMCLDRMHDFVQAQGTVVWLEESNGGTHFLHKGELPFDEFGLAQLIARFEHHDWPRPVVKNRLKGTLLGADFPGLNNLVVVSIFEGPHRFGWIVSCNPRGGREFGSVEAGLLNSVATILGTHVRNLGLYRQHEDLMLSFVRSFVSTLDAKDVYTRGHSERVALIARRLGQELGLGESDLRDVYLAGLLHDIGKIGVDDRILTKREPLSAEEFKQIQAHPMIGFNILAGLKNLQPILPGVRNHHEAYNGTGYPDGLKGEEIPLMARILAVADGYDAMGSDRPYRKGLPLDTIEDIFRHGAGEQWDARIIEAYFASRDDIRRLCAGYTLADGNLLRRGEEG